MRIRFARPFLAAIAISVLVAVAGCSGTSSFTGSWGVKAQGKPSLTISDDGSYSGTDGCNPVKGKGTISGGTFTFGSFASITQACDGVTPWLNLADTAKVDGNTLIVYNSAGHKLGTLDKR